MPRGFWLLIAICVVTLVAMLAPRASAADELTPLEIRQVKISGEIGRRIDVTVNNNLLVLNADKDFLPPFIDKKARDGYIGLGKLIDSTVRLAAYTRDDKVLALKKHLVDNLYAASDARFNIKPTLTLGVKQETDYPNSGHIVLKLDLSQPATFPLHLRIPAWAGKAQASVNGKAVDQPIVPGSFLKIDREWKGGDVVTLDLPMDFRLVRGRQRQAGRVAVMRGPQVFCLNPAQNPVLEKLDAADLSRLTLDPASLTLAASDAVRPGGVACKINAWKSGFDLSAKADYDLTLTEFPDPAGKATYFRLRDPAAGVDDELLYDKP